MAALVICVVAALLYAFVLARILIRLEDGPRQTSDAQTAPSPSRVRLRLPSDVADEASQREVA